MKIKIFVFILFVTIMSGVSVLTVHAEEDLEIGLRVYNLSYDVYNAKYPDLYHTHYEGTIISYTRVCFLITGERTVLGSDLQDITVDCMEFMYNPTEGGAVRSDHVLRGDAWIYDSDGKLRKKESIENSFGALALSARPTWESIENQGYGRLNLKTNIPIFSTYEDMLNYFETGDDSASINGSAYDDTLPGVVDMSVKGISETECHQQFQNCAGCLHLSWGIPEGYLASDTYTIKILMQYSYTTYYSTKRYYGLKLVDLSEIYDEPVYIRNYGVDLCAYEFGQKLNLPKKNSIDYVDSFDIKEVEKIYIRTNRNENEKKYYGDWYIYDCKKKTLSWDNKYEHVGEGIVVSGESTIDDNGNISVDESIKDTIPAPVEEKKDIFLFGIDFTDVGGVLSGFYTIINNLLGAIGSFPKLFSTVFCFLPTEISSGIVLIFYMAIIIGILKIFT